MFFRYFFALCIVALAVAVHVSANEEAEVDDTEARANPAIKVLTRIIKGLFASAAANCVAECANHCKQHWKHVHAATDCVKKWFDANRGRCAVGK